MITLGHSCRGGFETRPVSILRNYIGSLVRRTIATKSHRGILLKAGGFETRPYKRHDRAVCSTRLHLHTIMLPLLLAVALAACGQNMTDQPKYNEYKPAQLFRDGRVLQIPPAGTVARDDADRRKAAAEKPHLDAALLARGQEQFDIYCAPCHARTGAGNGMIVQRGMPRPPSYHIDRLRTADDQHFFDVITNGHGVMYSYAQRVTPRDRWAIVAYVRALQLSQNASLDDLPDDQRARLHAAQ